MEASQLMFRPTPLREGRPPLCNGRIRRAKGAQRREPGEFGVLISTRAIENPNDVKELGGPHRRVRRRSIAVRARAPDREKRLAPPHTIGVDCGPDDEHLGGNY